MSRARRLAWAVLAVLAAAAAYIGHERGWRLPDRYNPWAPLQLEESPNWLTGYKLSRLSGQPAACRAFVQASPLQAEPQPDRATGSGCGFSNALRVTGTHFRVAEPFVLSCPAVASLALWERHVVLPAAEATLGEPVQRLTHFGSYACRNVYGREQGARSQHATADALDVSGFVLRSGRRITVARDWQGDDAAARFLRQVHNGACGLFDGVLGPDYNRAHADHLHLDRGPYRLCR